MTASPDATEREPERRFQRRLLPDPRPRPICVQCGAPTPWNVLYCARHGGADLTRDDQPYTYDENECELSRYGTEAKDDHTARRRSGYQRRQATEAGIGVTASAND